MTKKALVEVEIPVGWSRRPVRIRVHSFRTMVVILVIALAAAFVFTGILLSVGAAPDRGQCYGSICSTLHESVRLSEVGQPSPA